MCLFISAELCAQGDESENNPETPLNTNQLETSEFSDENADAETSEQSADEERFESEEDPLTEEEEDPFTEEDDPFADEDDPFSEEEDPFLGESATGPTSEKSGASPELKSWQNYLDQKALILVNLMVRSHKTKERNTRLELAEKARQVIEEIDEEAQVRMEEERLSEELTRTGTIISKRIETETAAAMSSGDPETFISLFESGWFKSGYTPRLVLLYRLALEQRNESFSPSELPPKYSEQVRLYQEILDLHESGDSLLPVKERLEDQLEDTSSSLTDADLELALTIVNELESRKKPRWSSRTSLWNSWNWKVSIMGLPRKSV